MNKINKKMFKLTLWLIQKGMPRFHKRINQMRMGKNAVPRPSILFMKDYFANKEVIGVEIGVASGINASSIVTELNVSKLFLIDSWRVYHEEYCLREHDKMRIWDSADLYFKFDMGSFERVYEKFMNESRVEILRETSREGALRFKTNQLDFVYIDANHGFNHVLNDLTLWYDLIKPNGIIAGHDSHLLDVLQAFIDFCHEKNEHLIVRFPDVFFIKKEIARCKN